MSEHKASPEARAAKGLIGLTPKHASPEERRKAKLTTRWAGARWVAQWLNGKLYRFTAPPSGK